MSSNYYIVVINRVIDFDAVLVAFLEAILNLQIEI